VRLNLTASNVRVDTARRTIFGTLFRYGEAGHTDAGVLAVDDPGAIIVPADASEVTLVREHDQTAVRGRLAMWDDNGERVYVAIRVDDGPDGDAALAEAASRKRAGLSFGLRDADVVDPPAGDRRGLDGVIVRAHLGHIGQVADPAFNSARVDQIAASRTAGASRTNTEGDNMTPEQRARLAELIAQQNLTDEERTELDQLTALAVTEATATEEEPPAEEDQPPADQPASQQVAAARRTPAVPRGVPAPRVEVRDRREGSALRRMYADLTAALQPDRRNLSAVTAALSDVTNTANPAVEAPAWSGELWSGLQYQPKWTGLFTPGTLTSWEGSGWRWTTKPAMADYAGDKAAIPSAAIATEPSTYEAARMACGHDIDRKFYDFPNQEFLASYAEAAREDWAVKLDEKVRAYVLAQAVAFPTVDPDTNSLLKAAALAAFGVEDNTKAKATFLAVNRTDFLGLLDMTNDQAPAFLDMFGIKPENFVVDTTIPAGTVIAGVRQAATVRTLPGSPIRVDAQHIANGGVDTAFFGYWAIEEHHTSGIVKATFA
jgi:phage head maturation protease